MKGFAIVLSALLLTACSVPSQTSPTVQQTDEEVLQEPRGSDESKAPELTPGSNEILRAPLTVADGLEIIISDVIIPPNEATPRHYHPGEEFVYVIEGSVVHVEEEKPEFILKAGETITLAPEVEHAPRGTEEGARVIVFRVHTEGQPERILIEEEDGE